MARYPDEPGFVAGDPTSFAAARDISSSAASMRERVRAYIASMGATGATCDAVEEALDMRHQTCSARCRELVLAEAITYSPELVRQTRSGSYARIYVVTP